MIKKRLLISGLALGAIALAPSFAFESEKRGQWVIMDTERHFTKRC
jgi:hypothetical protein